MKLKATQGVIAKVYMQSLEKQKRLNRVKQGSQLICRQWLGLLNVDFQRQKVFNVSTEELLR